jgi:nucleolar protein 15
VLQEEDSAGEENVHLYGFSTDEDSSDDDLDVGDEEAALDMGTLPTIARDDAAVKRKLERAKRKPVRVSFSLSPALRNGPLRRCQKWV